MEAPFSEKEKRFVLAEAIKTSTVSVDRLLAFINDGNVQPAWTEMLLPFGRNLNSCISVWDALRIGPSSTLPSSSVHKRKSAPEGLQTFATAPPPKRRQSGADNMIRIQPKPSSNGSPISFSTAPSSQQPKKRGRPSKADVEARNAEAIARGEVIPPPKTTAPRRSAGGDVITSSDFIGRVGSAPTIASLISSGPVFEPRMAMPHQGEHPESEAGEADTSVKKKRGRPGSRSSKGGWPSEFREEENDELPKEPKKDESSSSAANQPFSQFEVTKPPVARSAIQSIESILVPPEAQKAGDTAPAISSGQVEGQDSTETQPRSYM